MTSRGAARALAAGRSVMLGCVILGAGCAARVPPRPAGAPTTDATAADAFVRATRSCAGLKTLTGELRLSGRAGTGKIGGTLLAGLAAPASVRFEAVAPFGRPFFILAGRDNRAMLLLPRENRVLQDASVPDVMERLTGLGLGAGDLRLILTGCLSEQPAPADGRAWPGGWQAVTLSGPQGGPASAEARITAYIKTVNGAPLVVAADHGRWRVDYSDHQGVWPRLVRLRSASDDRVDIKATIGQLAINTSIDDRAFVGTAPAGASPMTLDELTSVAPLRGAK